MGNGRLSIRIYPRKPLVPSVPRIVIFINMQRKLEEKPSDAIFFKAPMSSKVDVTAPQMMRFWPGLHLVGAGGAVKKGVFETVATVSVN